ncbi:MAG TPA: hypothetical protein VGK74_02340 [Symbiobacteriaceae bacterium]|jgi:hypothetical protein
MTTTAVLPIPGIWTPQAEVLCARCAKTVNPSEYARFRPEFLAVADQPIEALESDEVATTCDKCGRLVAVDEKVGHEHNLIPLLKAEGLDARMEQTGGGCSAVIIPVPDGGTLQITLVEEDLPELRFIVGRFDGNDEFVEDDYEGLNVNATVRRASELVNPK